MQLVEATEDDLETLVELWSALAEEMEAYSELNTLAESGVREAVLDGFRGQFEDDDVTNFLLRASEEPVGFVTLEDGEHPSRAYSKYVRIVNLFLKEEYRDEGYGTATIERIKRIARKQGCDLLKVSYEIENEGARRFYQDCGFREKQIDAVHKLD